jgi:osmotically-inducible protein OsmY
MLTLVDRRRCRRYIFVSMLPVVLGLLLAGSPAGSAVPARTDEPLALQATLALLTADLPGAQIDAAASHGTVELRGRAVSAAQKTKAEAVTRAVPGVKAVRNDVRVIAASPAPPVTDADLRTRLGRSVRAGDGVIDVVGVNAGRVTLRGDADTPALVRALRIVRDTTGVRSIALVRAPPAPVAPAALPAPPRPDTASRAMPDAWVTLRAKLALFAARGVHGFRVGVTTEAGRVELRGRVESIEERARAEQAVRTVKGAREVVNALEVWAAPKPPLTPDQQDAEIKRLVRQKLAADGSMNGIAVSDVRQGTVVLHGKAGLAETLRAIAIATSVPGVRGVNSQVQAPESDYSRESRSAGSAGGGGLL